MTATGGDLGSAADGDANVRELLERAATLRDEDPSAARRLALDARVLARGAHDVVAEAEALYRLATVDHDGGDDERAFGLALEAAGLARHADDALIEAWAEQLLAVIHVRAGNLVEALESGTRSLEVYRRSGHHADEPNILNTLAAVHQALGEHDRAAEAYRAALAASESLGRPAVVAMVLGNLARIDARAGRSDAAIEAGRRAVDLAREHRPDLVPGLLADLASVHAAAGDLDRAEARLDEVDAWWRAHGDTQVADRWAVAIARARVHLAGARPDAAVTVLDGVVAEMRAAGADAGADDDVALEIEDLLANAHRDAGRYREALEHREAHERRAELVATRATEFRLRSLRSAYRVSLERARAEVRRLRAQLISHPLDDAVAPSLDTEAAQLDAFERLAVLAEFRETGTGAHTKRVGDLSAEVAHALGEPSDWAELLRHAARLHDVGKVAVPIEVLVKAGPLTMDEYEQMKRHAASGRQLLSGSPEPVFRLAAELAGSHHEWWDGSGYPEGAAGSEIPLSGRIVACVDVFDALVSRRSYKREWSVVEAARFVISGAGTQFDPTVIGAFRAVLAVRYPEVRGQLDR